MPSAFDRLVVVMFENQYRSYVRQDPFMAKLAAGGLELTKYFGAFHPSQTNYIAAMAGELCGVTNDDTPAAALAQRTLVDLLEDGGRTWTAYMEGYPGEAWNPGWADSDPAVPQPISEAPGAPDLARYFRKHNAFASFRRVQRDERRWANIVDERRFWSDVAGGDLPDFAWFTPDIWNDGHYLANTHVDTFPRTRLVPQISTWLEYVFFGSLPSKSVRGFEPGEGPVGFGLDVDLLLVDPESAWRKSRVDDGTVIMITFDEADYSARNYDTSYDGPNQVYTVLLGPGITPGSTDTNAYNHYSLIRTVSRNFELADLGKNDRDANSFRSLWSETFAWGDTIDVGPPCGTSLAVALDGSRIDVFHIDRLGRVEVSRFDGGWHPPEWTGVVSDGPVAAAALDDTVHLVVTSGGEAVHRSRSRGGEWSAPVPVGRSTGALACVAYVDDADGQNKLMVAVRDPNGFMSTRVLTHDRWHDPQPVGQLTDGAMALVKFGPSLFLVSQERRSTNMRMASFNLAPYNRLAAVDFTGKRAPANDTSIHEWSAVDVPVGAFARHFAAVQHDYRGTGALAAASAAGSLHLVYRGVLDGEARHATFGLTGILAPSDAGTNGYGTLRQAGWAAQEPISDVALAPASPLAVAGDGERLHLVWAGGPTKSLHHCIGAIRPSSESKEEWNRSDRLRDRARETPVIGLPRLAGQPLIDGDQLQV